MPIGKTDLAALFDFLDEKLSVESGGDYRFTIDFLHSRNLPLEPTLIWLQQYGGHNDAEVLWNVEQEFEDFLN